MTADQQGNVWIVWLVVGFGAVGGILFGMDQANFAGVEHKASFIDSFCNIATNSSGSWGTAETCRGGFHAASGAKLDVPVGMTNFQAWGSSLIQLGAAMGALVAAPTVTRTYGRRAGLALGSLVVLVAMIGCILTQQVLPFYLSRAFTGIGIGMVTFTLPIWTAELAPKHIRGTLGCTMQLACVLGSQMAFGINIPERVTWQTSLGAPIVPAAIVVLFIFAFPESPRFLLQSKGRAEAEATLVRLRGTAHVGEEMAELETALVESESQEHTPWSVLWTDPSIRRRVIIANMLQWMQQLTGVNALLGQGPKLFIDAGVPMNENLAGFITSAFNFVGTIVMMVIVDKKGRRPLLLSGAVCMFFFMLAAGFAAQYGSNTTLGGYIILVCCCLYFFGFAIAWGGIPWVYPAEIFPMDIKEKALSTSVCSQWMANFLVAQITPRQIDHWGAAATFFFYSFFIACSFSFVYLFVPEVKGVAIEDMDSIFGPRQYHLKDQLKSKTLEPVYGEAKTPKGVALV